MISERTAMNAATVTLLFINLIACVPAPGPEAPQA
jgi:hypothetical protein